MQKFAVLFLAFCFGLGGCQALRRSETWDQVRRVRVDTSQVADPSAAYAHEVHGVLASRRVPHKVVTYQYRYTTSLREEAIGTRTAVIYRDDGGRGSPWWLADNLLRRPIWLPEADLPEQVRFYVRRAAEVVEVRDYPGGGDGKAVVPQSASRPPNPKSEPPREMASQRPNPEHSADSGRPLLSRVWSTVTKPLRALGRLTHGR